MPAIKKNYIHYKSKQAIQGKSEEDMLREREVRRGGEGEGGRMANKGGRQCRSG